MIHFVVPREQAFAMRDFLADAGKRLAPRVSIQHYEDLLAARTVPAGAYILSSLDQLQPRGRDLVASMADQLTASSAGVNLLNHPRTTLLRLELLEALHREGLNPHRAFRADAPLLDLTYPVFLREEHGHSGALTPLLHNARELAENLGLTLARGYRTRELLVVEFCDTADASGHYRKYAAFIVGSRIIARGLAHARSWMLKAGANEFNRSMLEEERAFVLGNPHEAEIRRIATLAGVQYGRIDYAVKDGRVVTWEINLNPTIGRGRGRKSRIPPELSALREPTREAWTAGLIDAFTAIDQCGAESADIVLARSGPVPPRSELFWPHDAASRRGLLRRMLRPFKPLTERLVRALSLLLVRTSRGSG